MTDTIRPPQIEHHNQLNCVSSSVHQYLNYSKKMQNRLAEINDNVSNMIKESCSGIDSICNKVRQCLNEMDMNQRMKAMLLMDDKPAQETTEDGSKSGEDISLELDDNVDETIDETSTGDLYIIEPLEQEKQIAEQTSIVATPAISPFITVVNHCNQANPNYGDICRKQLLNKGMYSMKNDESLTKSQCDSTASFDHLDKTISTICDNFELMNKLVENISEEISMFSETAISADDELPKETIGKKELITRSLSGLKPIKRLSKSNSRQKSVQVGDYCSDMEDLDFMELQNKDSTSFITPDVYRKRAFTDLYQKLIAQVEANDSLIFFQTLMKRQKTFEDKLNKNCVSQIKLNIPVMNYSIPETVSNCSTNKKSQQSKRSDVSKKYAGSLWFTQKHSVKDKGGTRNTSQSTSKKNCKKDKCKKNINKTVESKSIKSEQEYLEKKRNQSRKTNTYDSTEDVTKKSCSIECTCKMVVQSNAPASSSTKCHLQWLKAKPNAPQRKLQFLDILDDLTTRDLLPLQSEYPRRDCQQPRELDYKEIQNTYLYKLLYGQSTKHAWKQLFEPNVQCTKKNTSLGKSTRSPASKKTKEEKVTESFMDKFSTQNFSRTEVIKKLSSYMYDPDKSNYGYSQSVIVMPVRVYYDNFKTNEPPTKLKKPLSIPPLKDPKIVKRNDWSTPGASRPMKVVYDSLTKNPEVQCTSFSIRASVVPSKPAVNSARSNAERQSMKKATSRSFSPKSFTSYCQDPAKGIKRNPVEVKREESTTIYNKIQADIEKIKKEIYGKKVSTMERKLWANKYGKSVGQQLISFVENQKPEAIRPVPKYATPQSLTIKTNSPEKKTATNFLKKISPHRQILRHVQGLQIQNDAVQSNIKKAIDVIETRMVDILCDDSNSVEAFDIMEKEITNVLSLMKCNGEKTPKTSKLKGSDSRVKAGALDPNKDSNMSLEENFNIISDQLFQRLQRILDTGSSAPTTPTDVTLHRRRKEKDESRRKQKFSNLKRTKTNVLSPSTSASMEEKINTRRYPRSNSKRPDKTDVKSNSSTTPTIKEPINIENWENVCGDQSTNKNLPITSDNSSNQNDKKVVVNEELVTGMGEGEVDHILQNSGDYLKQEDIVQSRNILSYNEVIDSKHVDNTASVLEVEKAETLIDAQDSIRNNELYTLTDMPVKKAGTAEEVVIEQITNMIDSVLSLGETASLGKLQIEEEPSNDCLVKDYLESSNYNTAPSGATESDINIDSKLDNTGESEPSETDIKLDNLSPSDISDIDVKLDNILPSDFEFSTTDIKLENIISSSELLDSDANAKPQDDLPSKPEETDIKLDSTTSYEIPKTDTVLEVTNEENSPRFSDQVHKIIRRVENIYTQLDDIELSDSDETIPVFKETNIPDVRSEIFLTPFMHAVKETRKKESNKTAMIEKSPSYYNVMHFLDNLSNIQKEVPYETNTARLCYYVYVYHEPLIYHKAEIWHESDYVLSPTRKPSCLKKNSEESKQIKNKKVSFLEIGKEDKSSQVVFCPFHKIKAVRISSQQFPPLEKSIDEDIIEKYITNNDGITEIKKVATSQTPHESNSQSSSLNNYCKIHGNAKGIHETECCRNKCKHPDTKNEADQTIDGCEKTKELKISALDDKSTQVFCQMQEQKNLIDCSSIENVCLNESSADQSIDCPEYIEENPGDSKSTDKDFLDDSLIDPFFDYSNQNVAIQGVVKKTEEFCEGDNKNTVKTPPKIVIFREVSQGPNLPIKNVNDVKEIERYKKRLEKRREIRLRRRSSSELARLNLPKAESNNENVILLKSFYAIVYILMFTALSLDYRCL